MKKYLELLENKMKLLILSLFLLVLPGCVTPPTHITSTSLGKSWNLCYVKWSSVENKNIYEQGLVMTEKEKEKKGLQMPLYMNQGVLILDKVDSTFLVKFDPSDRNGMNLAKTLLSKKVLSTYSKYFLKTVAAQVWKVRSSELNKMTKGYEKVDCDEYQSAQVKDADHTESKDLI